MAERILTLRELNRAVLTRQHLLERAQLSPLETIRRLVALQGQVQNAPYIGLWTRMKRFERAELTDLIAQKQVIRAGSLRMTLHLMRAEDYMLLLPILQTIPRGRRLQLFASQTEGFDIEQFRTLMRAYLQEKPRTAAELRTKMREISPVLGQDQLVHSTVMQLALIQTFPAGTWDFTGSLTYSEAETWLDRSLVPVSESLRHLIMRYLEAFGPASVKDIQAWSGVTKLQNAINTFRSELTVYRDEQGQELFDLPQAALPLAEVPALVRFLPAFDNLLLAYEDRSRIINEKYRSFVFPGQAMVQATFLVDGFVQGIWQIEQKKGRATLFIQPFEPLSNQICDSLQQEGELFMHWFLDKREAFEICFSAPLMKG